MTFQELKEIFIEEYNTRIEELNDQLGGILREEPEMEPLKKIKKLSQADRSIVCQENHLVELWMMMVEAKKRTTK